METELYRSDSQEYRSLTSPPKFRLGHEEIGKSSGSSTNRHPHFRLRYADDILLMDIGVPSAALKLVHRQAVRYSVGPFQLGLRLQPVSVFVATSVEAGTSSQGQVEGRSYCYPEDCSGARNCLLAGDHPCCFAFGA